MWRLLVCVGLLLSALPTDATKTGVANIRTPWADVRRIEKRMERLGVRVVWKRLNSGVCARRGLLGVYKPDQQTVFMCQQSIRSSSEPLLDTLRHEGWHAVQQICNNGRAVLSKSKIFSVLTESDKRNLKEFYDRSQYPLEAEARAIEKNSTYEYLRGINLYC